MATGGKDGILRVWKTLEGVDSSNSYLINPYLEQKLTFQ